MSWDDYIDNLCLHGKDSQGVEHVDKACIIGMNGAKWTTDNHAKSLKITQEQATAIGKAFGSGDFTAFQAGGIKVEDINYLYLRQMDNTVLAKKKEQGALVLQASKTAVVIGHCPEGAQQGSTSVAVGKIVDYLSQLNM